MEISQVTHLVITMPSIYNVLHIFRSVIKWICYVTYTKIHAVLFQVLLSLDSDESGAKRSEKVVKYLLDITDRYDNTALHIAAKKGYVNSIKVVIYDVMLFIYYVNKQA